MLYQASFFTPSQNINSSNGEFQEYCATVYSKRKRCKSDVDT